MGKLTLCPYCEEHIKTLSYDGADFSCPRCLTIIATDIFEAAAFISGEWDGTGDYRSGDV